MMLLTDSGILRKMARFRQKHQNRSKKTPSSTDRQPSMMGRLTNMQRPPQKPNLSFPVIGGVDTAENER